MPLLLKHELIDGVRDRFTRQNPAKEVATVFFEEKTGLIMHFHEEKRLEYVLSGGGSDVITHPIPCPVLPVKNKPEAEKEVPVRSLSDASKHS